MQYHRIQETKHGEQKLTKSFLLFVFFYTRQVLTIETHKETQFFYYMMNLSQAEVSFCLSVLGCCTAFAILPAPPTPCRPNQTNLAMLHITQCGNYCCTQHNLGAEQWKKLWPPQGTKLQIAKVF